MNVYDDLFWTSEHIHRCDRTYYRHLPSTNKSKSSGNESSPGCISGYVNQILLKETELIRKCQKGEPSAQRALYSLLGDKMFRVAFRYVRSQGDAEDIMITAFTKIFKTISSFTYRGEGSMEGWMRKIVVNESLMWLRRKHNFNMSESLTDTIPETDLTEFSLLEAEDIYKMISDLPTGYRTVFNLNVIEGYSHQEIGEKLSITESTSRTQLFKAKALLKKMLTREGFQYGT